MDGVGGGGGDGGMQLSNKVSSDVWLLPKKIFGSPLLE